MVRIRDPEHKAVLLTLRGSITEDQRQWLSDIIIWPRQKVQIKPAYIVFSSVDPWRAGSDGPLSLLKSLPEPNGIFDEKTNEHIIVIEYRVRVKGTDNVTTSVGCPR